MITSATVMFAPATYLLYISQFLCSLAVLMTAGTYFIYVSYVPNNTRAINVPVQVSHAAGTTVYYVNQQIAPSAAPMWRLLPMGPFVLSGDPRFAVTIAADSLRTTVLPGTGTASMAVDAVRAHHCSASGGFVGD